MQLINARILLESQYQSLSFRHGKLSDAFDS